MSEKAIGHCSVCGGPTEVVHLQGFSGEAALYSGPSRGLMGSLAEGATMGKKARSTSGEELAVGLMEDGVHCPACKLVTFRYAN